MSAQQCVGCGEPLLPGSGRGRRARYHGAACRQRARRARLHVEHGRAWEALERADSAMVAARRAMTNGGNAESAIQALVRAALDLAELHGDTTVPDAASVAPSDARTPAVTKDVTEQPHVSRSRKPVETTHDDTAADASQRVELPPAIKPREIIDPDTVRMERLPFDRDDKRSKMVLAGHGDNVRLVGFLEPHGIQQKRWDALAPGRIRLDGGPFRTRQEALIRLVGMHVPFKTQHGRQRRSS